MLLALLSLFITTQAQPYFVTYIDRIESWWPPESIAAALGVPTYAKSSKYNVINFAFWTTNTGPVDAALVWSNAYYYVSSDNPWGNSTQAVQAAWLKLYHAQGIKAVVSAFGATDFPTSQGADPIATATSLANFVKVNQLDGVDLDWEDNNAMNSGKGEQWIIQCTQKLRELLPQPYIISHAPQGPYFMGPPQYPNGGYLAVNNQAGDGISYYNIQFYNQGTTMYETYNTLFVESDGWATNTAVSQLKSKNVSLSKIVIGKPVTTGDATNTGYVALSSLSSIISQGISSLGWRGGIMGWQYSSDMDNGDVWINTLAANF